MTSTFGEDYSSFDYSKFLLFILPPLDHINTSPIGDDLWFESEDTKKMVVAGMKRSIGNLFKKGGWEGDGEIRRILVPPFLEDLGDISGISLYFVKQSNNGTGFLVVPPYAKNIIMLLRANKDLVEYEHS